MNNKDVSDSLLTDNIIELILPLKAEYVSIARLTSSGVANRVGFDIETIEDIKVAVAEVCNKFITVGSNTALKFSILYHVFSDKLVINFDCEDKTLKCAFNDESDELGLSIINALMDCVEFCPNNNFLLSMSKALDGEK